MADDAVIRLGLDVGDLKQGLEQVQSELKQTAAAAAKSGDKMDDSFEGLARKQRAANLETKASIAAIRQQGRAIEAAAGEVAQMSDEMRKQTGIVDKLRQRAGRAERQLDELFRDGKIDVQQYTAELRRLRGNLSQLDGLGGRVTGGISRGWIAAGVALGGAYAAVRTLQTGFRALDSAFETTARVEGLRQGLVNLAGDAGRADAALQAVQSATRGTVSEMEAMTVANTAMSFGIAENSDQLEEMVQIATTLGASLGRDANTAVEKFSLALARQSPLLLDDAGITLRVAEAHEIHAASLGKSVDALTEHEKAQSFTVAALIKGRARMEELGGSIRTNADGWLRLKAALSDARVELSQGVATAGSLGDSFDRMATLLRDTTPDIKQWASTFTDLAVKALEAALKAAGRFHEAIEIIASDGAPQVKSSLEGLAEQFGEQADAIQDVIANVYDLGKVTNDQAVGMMQSLQEVGVDTEALGLNWREIRDAINEGGDAQEAILSRLRAAYKATSKQAQDARAKIRDAGEALGESGDEADDASRSFATAGRGADDLGDDLGELTGDAKAVADALADITSSSARFAELASQVGLVKQETADQLELLETLAQGAQDAEAALLQLWVDGKIAPDAYNRKLEEIRENQRLIAEEAAAVEGSMFAGLGLNEPEFTDEESMTGSALGGLAPGMRMGPKIAPPGGGMAGVGFEEETGFNPMDVLDPAFDVDEALEKWDLVSTAMQDGTMLLAEGQTQLAEAGWQVDGALQAQIKSMAKQGKAAQDVAKLNTMFGQAAAQAGGMLIDMAISGEFSAKRLLKATLESISGMAKAEAVKELAAGFAAMARKDPGAALHFKSAALWGGLAIASGIAAGAVGGGGEGGGPAETEERPYGRDRDVARTQELAAEDERDGPGVTVVIDGGNFIGTPDEEVARAISDIVEGAVADAAGGSSLRGG